MSQLINNSGIYTLTTENELAVVLSKFNSQIIFDIIQEHLANKYSDNFILPKANVVNSFEQSFINLKSQYPMDHENINEVRNETYVAIINILAKEYNLIIREDSNLDPYSLAYYMYDFLVANFSNYIIQFFSKYIYNERINLYNYFHLEDLKRNKDTSTLYHKKRYKDSKLGLINANLIPILNDISIFDITFENILDYTYADKNIVMLLSTYVGVQYDFYKEHFCRAVVDSILSPVYITNIRLELQKMQLVEDQ